MEINEVLAVIGGYVEQEVLLRNEYLAAENEILRSRLGKLRLTDQERIRLAKIAKRLGRKALEDVGPIFKPDTIFKWYSKLIAKKFDGSKHRRRGGRPTVDPEIEKLVIRIAEENPGWGYDRIQGALANLGYTVDDQTIGNILKRNGIPPAPIRKQNSSWADFIKAHADTIVAADFFTAEVFTKGGLVTFYVLFFIHVASRRVHIAGISPSPDEKYMMQIARNETMFELGFLHGMRYLIHDRDGKYSPGFLRIIRDAGVKPVKLPRRSPNLNPIAERWVRTAKEEVLSKVILFSEDALWRTIKHLKDHYHEERNHQGLDNRVPFPRTEMAQTRGEIKCKERLGGVLKFYYREAA